MSEETGKLSFREEFPEITTTEWEELIKKDLKGADYVKKLIWKTLEGFDVKPYYRSEDIENINTISLKPGEFPYVRGNKINDNSWEIRQDIDASEINRANRQALDVLNKGINSLGFKICHKIIDNREKFSELLKDICIECIPLHFLSGKGSFTLMDYLIEEAKIRRISSNEINGSFAFDPAGYLSLKGNFYFSEEEDYTKMAELLNKAIKNLPRYRVIGINGSNFSNAGSSIVQELGFSFSIANEYLSKMTDKDLGIDDVAQRIHFTFGIGSNYFMEIAKLRAARIIWSKIVEAYNPKSPDSAKMYIHTITTSWNKTVYDPYVNMLRLTTESMSATIGGTNSLFVEPFDSAYAEESDFSDRIARNTQIILKEEAYFDKIVDPAAGSYYIESLTQNIAEQVWKLFLDLEDKKGYTSAFKTGFVQSLIKETAEKRLQLLASKKEILLGTNQYANTLEKELKNIDECIVFAKAEKPDTIIAEPLRIFRGAKEFEQLRIQTEKLKKQPKVFLLTMGNPTMRKARAGFSSNFFACAGYEIIDNAGFESTKEGANAAIKAKADIVVVCSSDEEYPEIVPPIYDELKGKCIFVVAGAPPSIQDLKKAGVEHFINVKSNVLETLQQYQRLLQKIGD